MNANGLIALAVFIGGLIAISALIDEREKWKEAALAEGQAHRSTKSVLADVQQQLQSKIAEISVLKAKPRDDGRKSA